MIDKWWNYHRPIRPFARAGGIKRTKAIGGFLVRIESHLVGTVTVIWWPDRPVRDPVKVQCFITRITLCGNCLEFFFGISIELFTCNVFWVIHSAFLFTEGFGYFWHVYFFFLRNGNYISPAFKPDFAMLHINLKIFEAK